MLEAFYISMLQALPATIGIGLLVLGWYGIKYMFKKVTKIKMKRTITYVKNEKLKNILETEDLYIGKQLPCGIKDCTNIGKIINLGYTDDTKILQNIEIQCVEHSCIVEEFLPKVWIHSFCSKRNIAKRGTVCV